MTSWRWSAKRDRVLSEARMDGFTFREAANMVGAGCTQAMAKARMRELLAALGVTIAEIPEREVRYGSQGPLHPVIGPDHAEYSSPPATAEGEVDDVRQPPPHPLALASFLQPARRMSSAALAKIVADRTYYWERGIALPDWFYERAALACFGAEARA